jgi:hypothetical protein
MIDTPKEPRTAKPGSLLSQWWTLGGILTDRRTTGRHAAVAWVIVDRFMQKYGKGRSSLRYIENATGMSRHTVIKACRELTEWGHVQQILGVGTRPSEYIPTWLVVHPSTPLASGEPLCTTRGEPLCTTTDSSGAPVCTESCLPEPAEEPGLKVSRNDNTPAAPTAPPVAGLEAATAGTAGVPENAFDRFWNAYPRKHQRRKAEPAWNKIDPSPKLAEHIIEAAAALADHHAEHGTEKKWIREPQNWLTGKGWTEDLPAIFADPKEAAIAKTKDRPTKPRAANDNQTASAAAKEDMLGLPPRPVSRRSGRIEAAEVRKVGGATYLDVRLSDGTIRSICAEGSEREQARGQAELGQLSIVADCNIEDPDQLVGLDVTIVGYDDGTVGWRSAA